MLPARWQIPLACFATLGCALIVLKVFSCFFPSLLVIAFLLDHTVIEITHSDYFPTTHPEIIGKLQSLLHIYVYIYIYIIIYCLFTINLLCQTDLKHPQAAWELQIWLVFTWPPTSQDGIRVSEPQALPDCLKGKALFPHVTWEMTTSKFQKNKGRLGGWILMICI